MKKYLLLPLLLILITACSKSDQELLTGTWKIYEMKKDGKVAMSTNPEEQRKVVDAAWKEQGEILQQAGVDRQLFEDNIRRETKMLSGITFSFGEDGKVTVSANNGQAKDTHSPYTLNEEKQEITILQLDKQQLKYTYELSDEALTLVQGTDEISFKRKK